MAITEYYVSGTVFNKHEYYLNLIYTTLWGGIAIIPCIGQETEFWMEWNDLPKIIRPV